MFHVAVNSGSLGNTANTDVVAINDDVLSIRNSHHLFNGDLQLIAGLFVGAQLLRGRIASPSIAAVTQSYEVPLSPNAQPIENQQVYDLRANPLLLRGNEELIYQVTNGVVGPTRTSHIGFLQDSFTPAPRGQLYTLFGTDTTTLVANTWTTIAPTWNTTLPVGRYAVIGGVAYSATGLAFSLIFPGSFFRPGGLMLASEGKAPWMGQLNGGLGQWGIFNTNVMPLVRCYATAADTAETIYLQCIRLGGTIQG